MGDAGSLFIGFTMACLTLTGSGKFTMGGGFGHLLSVMAVPILILFIPLLDTGFVSLMRKLFARPISVGGKDHSSHRMVAIGFSERKAVIVLYAFAILSGFIALAIHYFSIGLSLLLIALYLLLITLFWIYLAKVKVYQEDSIVSGNARQNGLTPIIVQFTYKRRLFEVLLDFALIAIAYYAAYFLRFEGLVSNLLGVNFDFFMKSLPIVIACQIFSFYVMGIYRGIWEATGLSDLIDYVKAITIGTVMAVLILLFVYRFQSFSRVVFMIYWAILLILVSLSRLSFRLVDEGLKKNRKNGRPTLVYGAGMGGQMLLKELENNLEWGLTLVGFIDDNPRKQKRKIRGYPVLGGLPELERIIKKYHIEEIIISFRKGGDLKKQELISFCETIPANVRVSRMELTIR
jgi:UDP-GlcNAc:undecaprenyl-phosphate GlcNAc-1-phosphate transferase